MRVYTNTGNQDRRFIIKSTYLTKFDVASLRIIKNMNVAYNNSVGLLWVVLAMRQKEPA
jgi:hypothetical protein